MPTGRAQETSWRQMVLASMPMPEWLKEPGLHSDVVLSTRVRIMRNLRGERFPHHSSDEDLRRVATAVTNAAGTHSLGPRLETQRQLSPAERDFLVACRLVSADFAWSAPGRALLLDEKRKLSLMVNEEDHIRLQAVTGGWSIGAAQRAAADTLSDLQQNLEFAMSPRFGYLSASPYNCGQGTRISALFHLIGLAHTKRLSKVLGALSGRGLIARGLFGESSRALGAFVQVSVTAGPQEDFAGAGAYLFEEEKRARAEVGKEKLKAKTDDALHLIKASNTLSLPDSLRLLAWIRWGASAGLESIDCDPREVDGWFVTLSLQTSVDESRAAKLRASYLREELRL